MSPLAGQRVLVTRPRADAEELCALLVAEGADPVSIPVVRLRSLRTEIELESWRARIRAGDFDLLVFTSANAVRQLAVRPPDGGTVELYAIGPGTARAAAHLGWDPQRTPDRFIAESLADLLVNSGVSGRRVLLPRAAGARDVLPRTLEAEGARVEVVELYRAEPELDSAKALRAELAEGRLDWLTFTSSSTVSAFAELAGQALLSPGCRVACIGPVTARTAMALGLKPSVVAPVHSLEGLVAAVAAAPVPDNGTSNGLP